MEHFLRNVAAYAERRNHIESGHGNVSRLSPATRTRLLLEREVIAAARERYDPGQIEKFEQEVWWRLYWKGWLEQRPVIWRHYREAVVDLTWSERAHAVAAGESGVAIMDHFARELLETGYLHNHARMWWAAFWVHVERLPWQLGADHFLRHLLDGDAASNTLSWRWVAGLHTPGKSYLVRRSNLERYLDPALLSKHTGGLERLEDVRVCYQPWEEPPAPVRIVNSGDPSPRLEGKRRGLWLHDEDLLPEASPLGALRPDAALAILPIGIEGSPEASTVKRDFLRSALADGAARATAHFGVPCEVCESESLVPAIIAWAEASCLDLVVSLHPFCGPLADLLPDLGNGLAARGIRLELVRRPEDCAVMAFATGGFFGFWEKTATLRESI